MSYIGYIFCITSRDVSVVEWYNQRLVCMTNEIIRIILTRLSHMLGPGSIPGRYKTFLLSFRQASGAIVSR